MIGGGGLLLASLGSLVIAGSAACARAPKGENSVPEVAPPEAVTPVHASELLDPVLIAALPASERAEWNAYLATSQRKRDAERAAMDAELRAAGRERMERAPYVRQSFEVTGRMTDAWFRTDSARAIAENILSFQTPSGGWSKHIDFTKGPREPGQSWFSESDGWSYIGTFDNNATTSQLEFLARAHAASPDERYRAAFARGLSYLLDAQFPNGCWPQVYPLQGSYHDAATFNDDVIVHVLRVLRDVQRGRLDLAPVELRARVDSGLAKGIDCLVRSQVRVGGRATGWAQQHHPVTLAPVQARSYELLGLSGQESAGVTEFLMSLSKPEPEVIDAVHAAVDWLRKAQIHGYAYDLNAGLVAQPGAGPIWARLYEIGTDRPIFSNRDGVKLYDWNQLTDRRQGYRWFGTEAADVLKKYDESWSKRYPRRSPAGARRAPSGTIHDPLEGQGGRQA